MTLATFQAYWTARARSTRASCTRAAARQVVAAVRTRGCRCTPTASGTSATSASTTGGRLAKSRSSSAPPTRASSSSPSRVRACMRMHASVLRAYACTQSVFAAGKRGQNTHSRLRVLCRHFHYSPLLANPFFFSHRTAPHRAAPRCTAPHRAAPRQAASWFTLSWSRASCATASEKSCTPQTSLRSRWAPSPRAARALLSSSSGPLTTPCASFPSTHRT